MNKSLLACLALALSIAGALNATTQTFTDDFNRDNSSSLGSNWNAPSSVFLNANVVKTQTAGDQFAIFTATTLTESLSLRTDFYAQSAGRYVGLVFNYTDSNNYSLIRFNFSNDSATQWQFIEKTDSTVTEVDKGTIETGKNTINTWRTLSIVSTATAGEYLFKITSVTGDITYASKTLTSHSSNLSGNAGIYFGNSYIWADNFSLSTNISNIPELSTMAFLLGAVGLSGTLLWRKCSTARR